MAMSDPEVRLRELGRDASQLVDLPDLGSLARRGRNMRLRRQAGSVAAAVVLVTTGVFLFQDRTAEPQPAPPAQPLVHPYPGGLMQDLEAGTYEITPSSDAADPTVHFTVPEGWNSADGPNRFAYLPDLTREESLAQSTWSVGLLALKVTAVASEECQQDLPPRDSVSGFAPTVDALLRLPGATVVGAPRDASRFGYPATQLRMTIDDAGRCDGLTAVFGSDVEGRVGVRSHTTMDVWVVDVDGSTLVVASGTRGDVPERFQSELDDVVGSVRFVLPD
jgi:hypothetical protein